MQVEVRNAQELEEALEHGAEAILLDNMTPAQCERVRVERDPQGERAGFPTEASGGIVLENIRAYAETGVDFISVGALTHSAKAADISMTHRRGAELDRVRSGRSRSRARRHHLRRQAAFFAGHRLNEHRRAGRRTRRRAARLSLFCR